MWDTRCRNGSVTDRTRSGWVHPATLPLGRTGPGGCPVTEDVADRLVRLPLYAGLTDAEVATVIAAVTSFDGVRVGADR